MGTEIWIISLPLSDSILCLKIIHPPNFREEPRIARDGFCEWPLCIKADRLHTADYQTRKPEMFSSEIRRQTEHISKRFSALPYKNERNSWAVTYQNHIKMSLEHGLAVFCMRKAPVKEAFLCINYWFDGTSTCRKEVFRRLRGIAIHSIFLCLISSVPHTCR